MTLHGRGSATETVTAAPQDEPSISISIGTGVATSEAATASCWREMEEECAFRRGGATSPIYLSGDEAEEPARSPHPEPGNEGPPSPDHMAVQEEVVAEGSRPVAAPSQVVRSVDMDATPPLAERLPVVASYADVVKLSRMEMEADSSFSGATPKRRRSE